MKITCQFLRPRFRWTELGNWIGILCLMTITKLAIPSDSESLVCTSGRDMIKYFWGMRLCTRCPKKIAGRNLEMALSNRNRFAKIFHRNKQHETCNISYIARNFAS